MSLIPLKMSLVSLVLVLVGFGLIFLDARIYGTKQNGIPAIIGALFTIIAAIVLVASLIVAIILL